MQSKSSYTNSRGDTVNLGDIVYTGHWYYQGGDTINHIGFVTAIIKDCGRWHICVQPYKLRYEIRFYAAKYNMTAPYGLRPYKSED